MLRSWSSFLVLLVGTFRFVVRLVTGCHLLIGSCLLGTLLFVWTFSLGLGMVVRLVTFRRFGPTRATGALKKNVFVKSL